MPAYDAQFPKNDRQAFDGGKNNKFEKYLIANNESPDILNCISDNRSCETRLGSAKFNNTAVGSFPGDGLYTRHTNGNAESMCAWFNGTLYTAGTNTFVTVPSAQSIFTGGVRVCSAEYENYIFFNNGNNIPYKYNSHFTRHGVYPATTTATVASSAVGSLTGAYIYAYTNVNSNLVESDLSPLAATLTVSLAKVTVSNIATQAQSFGVEQRYIYRSKTSATTLFRVGILSNNTATTFLDAVADTALGSQAPLDNGVPPHYSWIIAHKNRIWCNDTTEPGTLWYSNLDDPYTFASTNTILMGDQSGEILRSAQIHNDGLIVNTDNQQYLVYMPTNDNPDNWQIIRLKSPYGSNSAFGTFSYNNKQMFPAIQNRKLVGFGAISGDAVDPEATLLTVSAAGSYLKSDRIEPDIFLLQSAEISRISSIVFNNKAYITVTYGENQTTNNRIYVFDFSISNLSKKLEATWTPWTGINAEQLTVYGGKLYAIDSTATGFVRELNKANTYDDSGAAINSYVQTKEFPGNPGDEQWFKDFRVFNLLYEKAGGYYMDVFYKVDSDISDGNRLQISLDPGGSLWGVMVWGVDNWGGGNAAGEELISLGLSRGKRIQFKFTNQNTAGQKFKIYGLQFSYNRKGRR